MAKNMSLKLVHNMVVRFIIGFILLFEFGMSLTPQENTDSENPFNISGTKYDLNQTMSIYLKKSDIKDVLMIISELTGLNIVISPNVTDTITADLKDVSVRSALDAILKPNGYSYFVQENVIIVKTTEIQMIGELETAVIKLKYISSNDLTGPLSSIMTSRGTLVPFIPVISNQGTTGPPNVIIVSDVQENIQRIQKLIHELDKPIPNINIAIRFIESQMDTSKGFGVDWSQKPIQLGESSSTDSSFTFPININNVNIGTLNPLQLSNALRIMQARGKSKLLSSPQVTTMDNHEAETEVVTTVYIEGLSNQNQKYSTLGTSQQPNNLSANFLNINTVQEKDIGIKLKVTPRVNEGNKITLVVNTTVEALLSAAEVSTDKPRSTKRTVKTQVTVNNGDTVIIGGLIAENTIENLKFVPILNSIPLIGKLFQSTSIVKEERELLIFITPNIVP
jgi:type II secretory pathway component GspD/PulD (secretin)